MGKFLLGFLVGGIVGILILNQILKEIPTAMDVYKNKTILKYEVVNNQKIDSVVIFK